MFATQEMVTLLYMSILSFIYCFHLWLRKLPELCRWVYRKSVPEPNLAGNGREDNPLSSLAIHRINGKLHLFYHFSSGLHQVIRI